MNYVQICTGEILETGECSVPLIWVASETAQKLTFSEFTQMMPALVGVLFAAWGIKQLLRLIFNR